MDWRVSRIATKTTNTPTEALERAYPMRARVLTPGGGGWEPSGSEAAGG